MQKDNPVEKKDSKKANIFKKKKFDENLVVLKSAILKTLLKEGIQQYHEVELSDEQLDLRVASLIGNQEGRIVHKEFAEQQLAGIIAQGSNQQDPEDGQVDVDHDES